MGVCLQFTSLIAYTGWALYVWVHVKTYGSHPECNDHIKYVILFAIPVRATVPWLHRLWMAVLIISSVLLMIGFVLQAFVFFVTWRNSNGEEEWAGVETEVDTGTIEISTGPLLCVVFSSSTQC
jgi:hypothetical protein